MLVVDADTEFSAKVKRLIALHMGQEVARSSIDPTDRAALTNILIAAHFSAASISQLLEQAIDIARGLRPD